MGNHENCRALLSSLSDYVDGALEEELCAEIERHMGMCENCRIVIDTLKKTIELYQTTFSPAEIPIPVRERLFHRLDLSEYMDM